MEKPALPAYAAKEALSGALLARASRYTNRHTAHRGRGRAWLLRSPTGGAGRSFPAFHWLGLGRIHWITGCGRIASRRPAGTLGEHRRWQATAHRAFQVLAGGSSPRARRDQARSPAPANPVNLFGHLDGQRAGIQAWCASDYDRRSKITPRNGGCLFAFFAASVVCCLSLRRTESCRSSRPPWRRASWQMARMTETACRCTAILRATSLARSTAAEPLAAMNAGRDRRFTHDRRPVKVAGCLAARPRNPAPRRRGRSGAAESTGTEHALEGHVGLSARNCATIARTHCGQELRRLLIENQSKRGTLVRTTGSSSGHGSEAVRRPAGV